MPPGAQVVDLDALSSPATTAAPNPPSTLPAPPLDLSTSTCMPRYQTDACDTVPEELTLSPSDHALHPSTITPPAPVHTPLLLGPLHLPPTPSTPLPCAPEPASAAPAASALQPPSTAQVPIQGISMELQIDLSH